MISNIRNISGKKNSSVVLNSMTELIILLLFIYILIVSFLLSKNEEEVELIRNQFQYYKEKYLKIDKELTIIIGRLDEAKIEITDKNMLIHKLRETCTDTKKYENLYQHFLDLEREYDNKQKEISGLKNEITILIGQINNLKKDVRALNQNLVFCQNENSKYLDYCPADECNSLRNQVIHLKKRLGLPSCLYCDARSEKIEPLYIITIYDDYMEVKLLQDYFDNNAVKQIPQLYKLPNLKRIKYNNQDSIANFNRISKSIFDYGQKRSCKYFVRMIIKTCNDRTFNRADAVISRYFLKCNPGEVNTFKLKGCRK